MVDCPDCGIGLDKVGGWWVCHSCEKAVGRVCEVYSRCVGYLRPVNQWNKGKQQEFSDRKVYKL